MKTEKQVRDLWYEWEAIYFKACGYWPSKETEAAVEDIILWLLNEEV